mmetsp:Transcript_44809/g.83696  ORF Transcript_44809/g.83696 Transcript_44809/m.83696 type:complete len:210 (-) Transcript_44809:776-1405(-)
MRSWRAKVFLGLGTQSQRPCRQLRRLRQASRTSRTPSWRPLAGNSATAFVSRISANILCARAASLPPRQLAVTAEACAAASPTAHGVRAGTPNHGSRMAADTRPRQSRKRRSHAPGQQPGFLLARRCWLPGRWGWWRRRSSIDSAAQVHEVSISCYWNPTKRDYAGDVHGFPFLPVQDGVHGCIVRHTLNLVCCTRASFRLRRISGRCM